MNFALQFAAFHIVEISGSDFLWHFFWKVSHKLIYQQFICNK
jgi:hypothetical protein